MGSSTRVFGILMLCGIIGICFAILLQLLHTQGILIDEFTVSTIVLRELQLGVIILWEIIGLGVAAIEQ